MQSLSADYETIVAQVLDLPTVQRLALIEALVESFRRDFGLPTSPSAEDALNEYADAELAALMQVEPLPPAEVVALGLLGTWADNDISDGAEWINQQKRQRRELPLV